MICQSCGIEAPTKYVAFYQNIGALVVRFSKSVEGELCKSCIHRYFWSFTGTTMLAGWWGSISFLVTPFFLLNNSFRYLTCLSMPAVPPDATKPELTDEAIEKLRPHTDELIARLNQGGKFEEVVEDIAYLAGVTPGQVVYYVR
ncbi:MAG: hypothetical protein ACRELF_19805, partial [Gemmataceae bacterium]